MIRKNLIEMNDLVVEREILPMAEMEEHIIGKIHGPVKMGGWTHENVPRIIW